MLFIRRRFSLCIVLLLLWSYPLRGQADRRQEYLNRQLFLAVEYGEQEQVLHLLARNAQVNSCSRHGDTPLFAAVRRQQADMVRLLLQHGAKANMEGPRRPSALLAAVRNGDVEITELLLKAGVKPDRNFMRSPHPLIVPPYDFSEDQAIRRLLREAWVRYGVYMPPAVANHQRFSNCSQLVQTSISTITTTRPLLTMPTSRIMLT